MVVPPAMETAVDGPLPIRTTPTGSGAKPTLQTDSSASTRTSAGSVSAGSVTGDYPAAANARAAARTAGPATGQAALAEQPGRCDVVEPGIHALKPCLNDRRGVLLAQQSRDAVRRAQPLDDICRRRTGIIGIGPLPNGPGLPNGAQVGNQPSAQKVAELCNQLGHASLTARSCAFRSLRATVVLMDTVLHQNADNPTYLPP